MHAPHTGRATVTLPGPTEILITRDFRAPAAAVFRAWTTPALVRRWWGTPDAPLTVCDIDLRPGGAWRYAMEQDGVEHGWHGVYQEIAAPERLVSTEVYEGFPAAEATNTLTLDEHDGVTTLRVHVVHLTQEFRDGHIASGMEAGLQRALDRVDDVLAAG